VEEPEVTSCRLALLFPCCGFKSQLQDGLFSLSLSEIYLSPFGHQDITMKYDAKVADPSTSFPVNYPRRIFSQDIISSKAVKATSDNRK
jgi:hypothetical protein